MESEINFSSKGLNLKRIYLETKKKYIYIDAKNN